MSSVHDVSTGPRRPKILFVCVHNAGRSQMAAAFARQIGGREFVALSAGSAPATTLHPAVVSAMLERGVDISEQTPTRLTDEVAEGANVVVTMGCGDACPVVPGARRIDWDLADPANRSLDEVRSLRDEIERLVRGLLADLTSPRVTRGLAP